jgi:hypothetical protein
MAEYSGSMETRVCDEAMFGVECDPTKHGSQAIEYIRTGPVPYGQDIKTYDLGLFQIATSDVGTFAEGTLLGHLYVEYSVVLGKPKLYTALGKGIMQDMYRCGSTVSVAEPFGTAIRPNVSNSIGCSLTAAGRITFPANFYGRVKVVYFAFGNDVTFANPAVTIDGNIDFVYIMGQNGNEHQEVTSAADKVNISLFLDVRASTGGVANSVTIDLSSGDSMWGMNLDIIQVNPVFENDWIS